MQLRSFVMGGLTGATLAYFFDPQLGRGRRARARDMAAARGRRWRREAERASRYAAGVAEGLRAESRQPGAEAPQTDDRTLVDRIRSDVFGEAGFPKGSVTIDASDGVVSIRGAVASDDEAGGLISKVRAVPGVRDVRNLLHTRSKDAPNKAEALRASDDALLEAEHVHRPERG